MIVSVAFLFACTGGCDRGSSQQTKEAAGRSQPSGSPESSATPGKPSVPVPSLARVQASARSQQHVETLRLAQAYLVANPNHPEALVLAAESLLALGRVDDSIDVFSNVPADDPQFGARALGQLADLQVQAGRPNRALSSFATLIKQHGDIALAHSRMAWILNSQGRRFEASKHLYRLAAMGDITRIELHGLVSISHQNAVSPAPGTTGQGDELVEGDLRRARQFSMRREWDSCESLTEKLAKRFPKSVAIAAFEGTVYADLQSVEKLATWHARLPEGIESQPEYWSSIAFWAELMGDFDGAVRAACESLKRDPTNTLLYFKLAQWAKTVGEEAAAEQAMSRFKLLESLGNTNRSIFEQQPTANRFAAMSGHLISLRRIDEALGWARLASKSGADPERMAELEQRLGELVQNRESIESGQTAWALCGLSEDSFALPQVHLRSDAHSMGEAPGRDTGGGAFDFQSVENEIGVSFQYDPGNEANDGSYLLYHTMGGGIGVVDFDLDGWPDVYFSQGGGPAFSDACHNNQMLRNLDGLAVADVTEKAGTSDQKYGQGVTVADINADGWPDVIVANIGANVWFQNNGDGSFSSRPLSAWNEREHWTSQIAAADLSGDGLPELIECNYIDDDNAMTVRCTPTEQLCRPAAFTPSNNRLLSLNGAGKFTVPNETFGIDTLPGYSLGVLITNMDGEAGNEMFIANDTTENELWISRQSGEAESSSYQFGDVARIRGAATGPMGELLGCMGIAVGDFDRNGSFDMHVTNYYNESSNLYLQQSGRQFVDRAAQFGLRGTTETMVGFGTHAVDLQRDGFLDLLILNGHAVDRRSHGEPLEMRPQLFSGTGNSFVPVAMSGEFWETATLGRTLAIADWNRDGRPDFWANHLDHPTSLVLNRSDSGNWIRFSLVGRQSERDATGARITVLAGDSQWVSWVTAGDGYFCTNESVVDIGLGTIEAIDRVTVDWPSGLRQQFGTLDVGRNYLLVEGIESAFAHAAP